jgi:hypothetical protein
MNQHEGHTIQLVYTGTWSRSVQVDENGDIKVIGEMESDDIDDTSLWCDTCQEPVTGDEIGANDDWEEV